MAESVAEAVEDATEAIEDALADLRATADRVEAQVWEALGRAEEEHDELQEERQRLESRDEAVWGAAAALHREAHDRTTAFKFCHADTCKALREAITPDWAERFDAVPGLRLTG